MDCIVFAKLNKNLLFSEPETRTFPVLINLTERIHDFHKLTTTKVYQISDGFRITDQHSKTEILADLPFLSA